MDVKSLRIVDVNPDKWVKFKIYDRNYRYEHADGSVYAGPPAIGSHKVSGVNANNWISQESYGQLTIDLLLRMAQAFEDGKAHGYQPKDIAQHSSQILNFILLKLFVDGYAQPYIQSFPECAISPDLMIDRVHYTVDPDRLSHWAHICRARHLTYEAEVLDRAIATRGCKMYLHHDIPPLAVTEEMEAMLSEYLSKTF